MIVRLAVAADRPFLERMLAAAADWRADAEPRPVAELLRDPAIAHYIDGWPRAGDGGVVAEEDGRPLGAAWWRFFTGDDPGYGFIDEATPELSIGVVAEARGRGVGTALMEAALVEARDRGIGALSLSVELDNPAKRLYERTGFTTVAEADGAATMVAAIGRSS